MSKFTKRFTKTIEFDGDEVTVVMSRLKRKDALKIAPLIPQADHDGKYKMTFEGSLQLIDRAADFLPKYIYSIKGLTYEDDEGRMVSPVGTKEELEDMLEETYFMGFFSDVLGELMDNSFVGDATKKSSKESQQDTSQVLEGQEASPLQGSQTQSGSTPTNNATTSQPTESKE